MRMATAGAGALNNRKKFLKSKIWAQKVAQEMRQPTVPGERLK